MSLTITIGRVQGGGFRAEVADRPQLVIENAELPRLVEELKQVLDSIAVNDDGTLFLAEPEFDFEADDAARAEVERTALRNAELDELIERYPVPAEWGEEPGWSDDA
jgi:hypothetical protein